MQVSKNGFDNSIRALHLLLEVYIWNESGNSDGSAISDRTQLPPLGWSRLSCANKDQERNIGIL